jgi:hypothetical protein
MQLFLWNITTWWLHKKMHFFRFLFCFVVYFVEYNNMVAAQNLYLVFGFMAITGEPLETDM